MRHLQKLAEGVVILPVTHSLIKVPELWQNNGICVRWGNEELVCQDHNVPKGTKELAIDIMRLLNGVQLGGIFFERMETGTRRPSHEFGGTYDEFYHRYYLILQGLPGVSMTCEDETIPCQTGDLWWTQTPPAFVNNSKDDFIYMTVDIRIDP